MTAHLASDIRHTLRRWKSRPAFAATAIITLGLGIAATTAIFSVVDAVLLKPLPWRDANQLVTVYVARPHWRLNPVLASSWNNGNVSWPIFKDLQSTSRTIVEVGTWTRLRPTLNGERNELVGGLRVSAGFLPMLGVAPYLGRFFTATEDESPTDAVIVSFEAWQRRFGGSPSVLGHRVSLDETMYSIVGVLPPRFDFLGRSLQSSSSSPSPEFVLPFGNEPPGNRHAGNHFMYAVARVRAGVPLDDVLSEIDPLVRGAEKPEEKQARIVPLVEDQLGAQRRPMWLLGGAASLLLLIACANVAGLLLGDAGSRRYEMAVRLALGGSRRQLTRQFFVESVLLAAMSILAAMALVAWLTPLLASLAPEHLPRVGDIAVNLRVFGFAIAIGLATAVIFGTTPALTFARINPARWTQSGTRGASRVRYRAHNALVAGEVMFAVVLVAAASLFGETLLRMAAEHVGFRPQNLIVASLRLPRETAITNQMRVARTDDLVARLAALPGVEGATATSTAPFSGSYGSNGISIDGKTFDVQPSASRHIVTQDYFRTLGIPIVKGRGFVASDAPGDFVAVVTEEFERRYLDGDAIGKRFTLNKNVHEVVGVVPGTKHRRHIDEVGPAFYALNRQLPTWTTQTFIIRTATPPESMLNAMRKTIESSAPTATIATLETMTAMMRRSLADERYRATLSVAFGVLALILAAVGLYGLLTRSVTDRYREIGIRLALGAQRGRVLGLVLKHASILVCGGLLVGIPAALGASRLIGSLLWGVSPASPHTFVGAAATLTLVALAAAYLPARRATRTDPVVALRD